MVSVLLLLLVLSSGGFLSAVLSQKSFGEMLPVTCVSLILIVFAFGVVDHLLVGIYFVLAVTTIIYLTSIGIVFYHCCNGNTKLVLSDFSSRFFSMGFFAFAVFIVLDFYCNTGRLVSGWDDFSHWATTVKQMTLIDKLSVSPEATFVFYKNYPPGTALFLYFFQKITFLLNPTTEFSEWRLFFSQHILMIAFVTPFFDRLKYRNILSYLMIVVLYCAPFVWYSDAYSSFQVDYLVSLVFGAGMASVVLSDSKSDNKIFTCACISLLILLKSTGLLFAISLTACLISSTIVREQKKLLAFKSCLIITLIPILTKFLWNYAMAKNGVEDNSGITFDSTIFQNIIFGKDSTFRGTVFSSYLREWTEGSAIQVCGIEISYLALLICFITLFFLLLRQFPLNKDYEKKGQRTVYIITSTTMNITLCIFAFGLLLLYLFHFSESEALGLASFHRYIGMGMNGELYFFLFVSISLPIENKKEYPIVHLVACTLILISLPFSNIRDAVTRTTVRDSYIIRSGIGALCEKTKEYTDNNSSVYLVHQGARGYSYWMSRFLMMPVTVNPLGNTAVATWNFSDEEDRFSKVISAEDWQDELKETCDYVMLFIIDDYFKEKYWSLFENRDSIKMNSIYQIDKSSGKLLLLSTLDDGTT